MVGGPYTTEGPYRLDGPYAVEGPYTVTISPANAGTDDTPPSLSMSYTSTEYTPVPRGPLEGEEGHRDMFTGVSSDLTTILQYVTPVCVSVRYTKHPVASEPGFRRHTSPVGDEVLTETPTTSNVPTKKGFVHDQMDKQCSLFRIGSLMTTVVLVFP